MIDRTQSFHADWFTRMIRHGIQMLCIAALVSCSSHVLCSDCKNKQPIAHSESNAASMNSINAHTIRAEGLEIIDRSGQVVAVLACNHASAWLEGADPELSFGGAGNGGTLRLRATKQPGTFSMAPNGLIVNGGPLSTWLLPGSLGLRGLDGDGTLIDSAGMRRVEANDDKVEANDDK